MQLMHAPLSVLVAEDDDTVRELVAEMLTHLGHSPRCVAHGQAALEACLAAAPGFDLVLMDLDMPVMDGPTAIRHIREDARTRALPIMVVSANPPDPATAALTNGRLAKPFGMRALREALAALPIQG